MRTTQYVIEDWEDEVGQFIIKSLKAEFGPSYGFELQKVRQFMADTLAKNRNLQAEIEKKALYHHHDIVFTYLIFTCWREEPGSKKTQASLLRSLVLALETCDDKDIQINEKNYGGFVNARGEVNCNCQPLRPPLRLIQVFFQNQIYSRNLLVESSIRSKIYNLLNEQRQNCATKSLATWFRTSLILSFDNCWITLNDFVAYLFNPQFYQPKRTYPASSFLMPVIPASENAHAFLFAWFSDFVGQLTLEGLCQLDRELQSVKLCPLAEKNHLILTQKLDETRSNKYQQFVVENGPELAITTYGQLTDSGFQLSARFGGDKTPELLENQVD